MELIKVKDGLLEVDNFYLTSFFSDFAGTANITRNTGTRTLQLISNNSIERRFCYKEFVIEFEKENFENMKLDDYCCMYLGNKESRFGIKETNIQSQNRFWRILKRNNYIQAYVSEDNLNFQNIGGMNFDENVEYQGFEKFCHENLILKNYKVYSNPYVILQNIPQTTIVEFYNKDNMLLLTRKSDENMECKIFLESEIQGYFKLKDMQGNILHVSKILNLSYGDIYVLSKYNLQIIYNENIVTNDDPATLGSFEELITIKNLDTEEYKKLILSTSHNSHDLIELSVNGINYQKSITIDSLKVGENKNIFVRIIKTAESKNFIAKEFQLVIEE